MLKFSVAAAQALMQSDCVCALPVLSFPGTTSKMPRFYGIRSPGNAAGVYKDWDSVKALVHGVSGKRPPHHR